MKKGIISVISVLTGAAVGGGIVNKNLSQKVDIQRTNSQKHLSLYLMMNQWVKIKQEGKNLAAYFDKNGYRKIAVYGMSYAGTTLLEELEGTDVQIAYGIDKNADSIYADVDVVSLEEPLADVDAIVVTAITFFDEIKKELSGRVECPILSLEDILYEV